MLLLLLLTAGLVAPKQQTHTRSEHQMHLGARQPPPPYAPKPKRAHATRHQTATTRLAVQNDINLPRNRDDLVSQLKDAAQSALNARHSRIAVQLPRGFDLGVEPKQKAPDLLQADARANRQLARLFVEMFDNTGLQPTVCFASTDELEAAKKAWGRTAATLVALTAADDAASAASAKRADPTRKLSAAAKKVRASGGGGGFGRAAPPPPARAAVSQVPPSAEVVFAVGPASAQQPALERFCSENGLDRLVVLLNPRCGALAGFEDVYVFDTSPAGTGVDAESASAEGNEGGAAVLWRSFPSRWALVRPPTLLGRPKVLIEADERPTREAVVAAMAADGGGGDDGGGDFFDGFKKALSR